MMFSMKIKNNIEYENINKIINLIKCAYILTPKYKILSIAVN